MARAVLCSALIIIGCFLAPPSHAFAPAFKAVSVSKVSGSLFHNHKHPAADSTYPGASPTVPRLPDVSTSVPRLGLPRPSIERRPRTKPKGERTRPVRRRGRPRKKTAPAKARPREAPPRRRTARPPASSAPRVIPPLPERAIPPAIAELIEDRPHRNRQIVALVGLEDAEATRLELMEEYGLTSEPSQPLAVIDAAIVRFSYNDGRPFGLVIATLSQDVGIVSVQPNYIYEPREDERQSLASAQYSLQVLNLDKIGDLADGEGITIAVIDTCIDRDHSELRNVVVDSYDASESPHDKAECGPEENHGTAIAGIISARNRLRGIAPRARLLAARAFSAAPEKPSEQEATTVSIARALDWASSRDAEIFNLSFSGPPDPIVRQVVEALIERGAFLVAAAGNSGPSATPAYPAAYDGVVAVTAVDTDRQLYKAANQGEYIEIAAPGVDVLVPLPDEKYDMVSGTSFAAAHVSAVAALILQRHGKLRTSDLHNRLMATAFDLGAPGRDPKFGVGLANAGAAMEAVPPSD